jgi:hypothetical protein
MMRAVERDEMALDRKIMDARAPGLARADLIFVFGTRLVLPAELAADHYLAGLAPLVRAGRDARTAVPGPRTT